MKTKNNGLFFTGIVLSLLCIFLYACEGETIDPNKSGTPLQLKAEIGGLKTRVSGSSWEKNDAIGVYMVKEGQSLNSTSVLRQNVKYVTTGSDDFKPAKDAVEIVLPFDESIVDFISYYPHRENISNFSYPVDLSIQSVQANIDLMYSNNVKKISSENPNVKMQFSHQLSKMVLNITKDSSLDLKNLSVIITNTSTQAAFDLNTGNLTVGSKRDDIQLWVSNDGSVVEAILLPGTDLAGMDLWFIIGEEGNEAYKMLLKDALKINSFEKSTKYTYNVTLFYEKTFVVTEGGITAWIDKPAVDLTVDRTNAAPPVLKGSKKDPFSVAEAQSEDNDGKIGVWVEGYIVGYFSGSSMGSFSTDFSDIEKVSKSNLAIADNQNETDITRIIPVQLGSGNPRNALNLNENPGNLNKRVKIKGELGSYFSAPGLRDIKEYLMLDQQ